MIHPDMISDRFADGQPGVGRTYPALGLAVIAAVDVAVVMLLRLLF